MKIIPIQQVVMMTSAILSNVPRKESEIDSLTHRVEHLTHAADFWNGLILWGLVIAAIAAVWIVWSTRLAVIRAKELATAQGLLSDAKDRQLQADLRAKDIEIGNLRVKADAAETGISEANQRAAEANAKAEGFRLDIATANERAAKANQIAEQERFARIQLEASLADRVLTSDGHAQLENVAKEFPNGIHLDICAFGGTLEVANIAQAITDSLNGWTVREWQITGGGAARGILIGTSPSAADIDREAAQHLIAALNSAGIVAHPWKYDDLLKAAKSGMRSGPMGDVDAPILMVLGTKR